MKWEHENMRSLILAFAIVGVGAGCSSSGMGANPDAGGPTYNFAWDWVGVVGTGQSLSVGALGTPVLSTTQPYNNLKLGFGGAAVAPPFDSTLASLAVEPL